MGKVILDDALRARLNGLNEQVEVCEADGRVVGWFLPGELYKRLVIDLAKAEFDLEKADEAAKGIVRKWDGTNGKTTAEAIAYLQSLWQQQAGGR